MKKSKIISLNIIFLVFNSFFVFGQNAIVKQEGGSLKLLKAADSKPRNIIFILTDDHRYDALGFLKAQTFIKTPNLDRLAERGGPICLMLLLSLLCALLRGLLFLQGFMRISTRW